MSTQLNRHRNNEMQFNRSRLESILLEIADEFDIRLAWDKQAAILTGVCAIAGGVIGGYTGGRVAAAVGAGIGGAAGLALVSLRQVWSLVKALLEDLLYILFNYLRRLDPSDYVKAYDILMACAKSRRDLVVTIVSFIVDKLGRKVVSNITAA